MGRPESWDHSWDHILHAMFTDFSIEEWADRIGCAPSTVLRHCRRVNAGVMLVCLRCSRIEQCKKMKNKEGTDQ